jgi:hypothetical protein
MNRARRLARGVWDFLIGDDWRIAAGVVVALGVTAAVAAAGGVAWWIAPVLVAVLLALSVWRAGAPG